jgi:PIN domain nuclease of toxin-antitoxin system
VKALLDTHSFLWWDSKSVRLSSRAIAVLQDPATLILLSVVSIWEMAIKSDLGKLTLRLPLDQLVAEQVRHGIAILPVDLGHVLAVEGMPAVHRDPFDRLLIAQAKSEGAVLVTADPVFARYPVPVIW